MWNHFVEPELYACQCGLQSDRPARGSMVPFISELCPEMNPGPWFLDKGLEDLKLVEPVEPSPKTQTFTG